MAHTKPTTSNEFTALHSDPPSRIAELAGDLTEKMDRSISQIKDVNNKARLLSFNAQIEAARAGGQTGAAFAVVAQAMQELSGRTSRVADDMINETGTSIEELNEISHTLRSNVRGVRLTDLAASNIDLIDRNLFERTCDVRWWATDSSVVEALGNSEPNAAALASKRMGVILSAYTVYFDLVLADREGRVIANGRPDLYDSVGVDVSRQPWFTDARTKTSGEGYGFQTCHRSPLVNDQRVLAYSCAVRERGEANAPVTGVLGALFKWDDLAQTIVTNTPLSQEEWSHSRVCIVDKHGVTLADSDESQLETTLDLDHPKILDQGKAYCVAPCAGVESLIAHASAPGYEGYSTGWHSLVIQTI